ncbi:MAG: mycofactocin-associated electron transfer flavoprotein alpha subunit, partial [Acidimicrobiales bacterium]
MTGVTGGPTGSLDTRRPVAVVVARDGRLPFGADEAAAESEGQVIVVGSGTEEAARSLSAAVRVLRCETGTGFRPGALAAALAPVLLGVPLVILPSSPDGRDLGPRLAAVLDRPFIGRAVAVSCRDGGIEADVTRLDDRVLVTVSVEGPAVATLVAGSRSFVIAERAAGWEPGTLALVGPGRSSPTCRDRNGGVPGDPEVIAVLEPEPATMDLADASAVFGGGAGLASDGSDQRARAIFDLLVEVAAAMGASAGATRVATDAGWVGHERQIGTTGALVDPDLYVAFGVSGAVQHVGGLGSPRHVVSVNTDPSCPMTSAADLGLVTDGPALLV